MLRPARHYRALNAQGQPLTASETRQGLAYTEGYCIDELLERFADDAHTLDAAAMLRRYGKLTPRGGDWRPNSVHLRSPLYTDQYGIEYTPLSVPTSQTWFLRVPHTAALHISRSLQAGELSALLDLPSVGLESLPQPGTALLLRRTHHTAQETAAGDTGAQEQVVVQRLVAPLQASAEVVFDHAISSEPTVNQSRLFEARRERNEQKALRDADAERPY